MWRIIDICQFNHHFLRKMEDKSLLFYQLILGFKMARRDILLVIFRQLHDNNKKLQLVKAWTSPQRYLLILKSNFSWNKIHWSKCKVYNIWFSLLQKRKTLAFLLVLDTALISIFPPCSIFITKQLGFYFICKYKHFSGAITLQLRQHNFGKSV